MRRAHVLASREHWLDDFGAQNSWCHVIDVCPYQLNIILILDLGI